MSRRHGRGQPLTLHVKNQPPSKVLDLILSNGNYVAKRDGTIVSIRAGHRRSDRGDRRDRRRGAREEREVDCVVGSRRRGLGDERHHSPDAADTADAPHAPDSPHAAESSGARVTPASSRAPPRLGQDGHRRTPDDCEGRVGRRRDGARRLGRTFSATCREISPSSAARPTSTRGARCTATRSSLGGSLDVDDGATIDGDVTRIGGSFHSANKAHVGGNVARRQGVQRLDHG